MKQGVSPEHNWVPKNQPGDGEDKINMHSHQEWGVKTNYPGVGGEMSQNFIQKSC